MKKNKYSLSLSLKFLTRVVLLTIMGTSFLCFSVKGDPVEPQRVSLNLKDVSLSVLFQEMKKQTSYKFFYNDVQVKDVGNITVVANNETVESVLDVYSRVKNTRTRFRENKLSWLNVRKLKSPYKR